MRVAGVVSAFPVLSVAATVKMCVPAPSPDLLTGELGQLSALQSKVHENVPGGSVEPKSNVATVLSQMLPSAGPDVIVVSGARWSVTVIAASLTSKK